MAEVDNSKKIVDDYKRNNFEELESFKFNKDVGAYYPSGYNQYTYYNCLECINKSITNARIYNKYSNKLIEKLIEVTVDINKQLNNEWTKNGQYFENKVEFFDSYLKFFNAGSVAINPDYKSILKEKKANYVGSNDDSQSNDNGKNKRK